MATFIIETGSPSVYGSRAGNDRYVFNPNLVTSDRRIFVTDTQGENTIFLDGGLSIASSRVLSNSNGTNGLELTLSNGAVISIGTANGFRYQTGGEGVDGAGGRIESFDVFVTNSLRTTVPSQGNISSGGPTTVNEGGGTTSGGGGGGTTPTVSVTPNSALVNEGQDAFFNVSAPGVADGTNFTFQISGTVNSADIGGNSLTGSGTIINQAAVIRVPLANDSATEGNERLIFTVSVPGRANASTSIDVVDTSQATVTYTLTADQPTRSVNEGSSGSTILSYTLSLDRPPTTAVSFNVAVQGGGSATNGQDFSLLANTVTFSANQQSQVVSLVEILDDTLPETTEQFTLQVTGPLTSPVNLGVTILDTDAGNNFTLTQAANTVNGTPNPDVITGTVSGVGSTFTNADKIDGLGGRDVLRLTLNADFGDAFRPTFVANPGANDGFVRNIETLELANGFIGNRTFNASNITGVDTVSWDSSSVNGGLNVTGLGNKLSNLNITRLVGANSVNLTYVAPAVDTFNDTLALQLDRVGTPSTATAVAVPATVTSAGISYENVNITAIGANALDLGVGNSVGTTSIAISGAGTVQLTNVLSTLQRFDASAATGVVQVDLNTTNLAISTVVGGSANDTITVRGDTVAGNARLDGGGGDNDRLIFSALNGNNIVPSVVGFEVLEFRSVTGTNNILATPGSSGVTTVLLSDGQANGGQLTLNGLYAASGLTVVSQATSNSTVFSANNLGTATFRTVAAEAATAAAPTVVTSAVTFSEAAGAGSIDVGANTQFGNATAGEVNFAKATSLNINAVGALGVTGANGALGVVAPEATSLTLTTSLSPNGLQVPLADFLDVDAVKVTNVNLTTNRDLTLVGSTLTGATQVVVNAGRLVNGSGVDLESAASLSITGGNVASSTQQGSQVIFGNVGSGALTSGVVVTASGLASGLMLGGLLSAESVNLNVAGVVGSVQAGSIGTLSTKTTTIEAGNRSNSLTTGQIAGNSISINAANTTGILTIGNGFDNLPNDVFVRDNLTFTGSGITASGFDISAANSTSLNVTLNTGLASDSFSISGSSVQTAITVAGNLGSNPGNAADQLSVSSIFSTASQTINIANLLGVEATTITGGTGNDAITGGVGADSINGGSGADVILGGAGADTLIGGAGADSMTGALGTNVFRFAAAADVTAGTPDTITDFDASATNILSFNGAAAPGFGLVGANALSHFEGIIGTFANTNNVVVITTAVVGALTAANAATAIGSATGNYMVGDGVIFVVSNNTDSAVFKFTSAAADATVTAAELGAGPIVTLTGVNTAELTATGIANFVLSA